MSEVGCQRSEVRCRMSDVRCRMSEVRGQRAEVGGKIFVVKNAWRLGGLAREWFLGVGDVRK
jgi:hypothetical protein